MPFQPEHLEGLELAAVEAGEDAPVDGVALALEPVDGVEVRLDALHRLEPGDEQLGLLGHPHEQVGLLAPSRGARGDLGEEQELGHGLDVVDHVVELLGQGVDVLPVERA